MLSQHVPNSGQRIKSLVHFKSRGCPGYCHGELVVAIGSRVSRKTVNSVGRGPAYHVKTAVSLISLGNNNC